MTSSFNIILRLATAACVALPAAVASAQQTAPRQRGRDARDDRAAAVLAAKVVDDDTEAPVAGVTVAIAGATSDFMTDARGNFTVAAAAGARLVISLRRLGYRAAVHVVEVPTAADTTRVTFFLLRAAQALDTVAVAADAPSASAKLEGFERRRAQHIGGTFLTRAYIERRNAVRTIELLRGLLGVRVVDSLGVRLLVSARGVRPAIGRRQDAAPCSMLVGVDGQLKNWGYDVDDITPGEIHGIEVYSGPAAMPRELMGLHQSGSACGLVMIWTRADR